MADECTVCKMEIPDGVDSLERHLCKKWTHRTCIGYTAAMYKTLEKCNEARWYCKETCSNHVDNQMQLMNAVIKRLEQVEAKNADLETRLLQLQDGNQNIDKTEFKV